MVTKRSTAAAEPVVDVEPADDHERALLEERAGYVTFGRDDRVADVDRALVAHRAARARAAAAPETVVDRSGDDDGFETA